MFDKNLEIKTNVDFFFWTEKWAGLNSKTKKKKNIWAKGMFNKKNKEKHAIADYHINLFWLH